MNSYPKFEVSFLTRVNLKEKKFKGFLTKGRPLLLRLAVVSQSGKRHLPHVSSVWYLFRDDCFWISTSEDRLKVKAIRQNDRVALIIDNDLAPYKGIIVEGIATLTKVNVETITREIVKRYVPKKHVESQFEDLMKYPRILIRVKPLKTMDIMSYKKL